MLECAEGHAIAEVARRLRTPADTVRTWRRHFLERRLDGLCDEPRPGVPRKIADADAEERHALVDKIDGRVHRYDAVGDLSDLAGAVSSSGCELGILAWLRWGSCLRARCGVDG
ncbi:helix-turn-helix domain-containing protein [Streptomyces sp. NPDC019396]|uniref:helix-turn-helix domain-containing protein n=1 Tax=Streptomyces sp. NPDC019396 TaxID=3154687 RepID=UPI0033C9A69E